MKGQLFDTNILIDFIAGNQDALHAIDGCDQPFISTIVWIEVLIGRKILTPDYRALEALKSRKLLDIFTILPIDNIVSEMAVQVARQAHSKLPDALIHATAIVHGIDIVTRNKRDFLPLARVPEGYSNINIIEPYQIVSAPPAALPPSTIAKTKVRSKPPKNA